ncbi:hypothetical protein DYB38_004382 [Aphanomyces astaci]|uniref:Uncharacterized protein n=1 Tax=Aphanomyces astaci TaxID=112090 RepID=A0A397D848_APHAT|nr:hypothetical protein DYB38_004382 [Aphanomyces astaci]
MNSLPGVLETLLELGARSMLASKKEKDTQLLGDIEVTRVGQTTMSAEFMCQRPEDDFRHAKVFNESSFDEKHTNDFCTTRVMLPVRRVASLAVARASVATKNAPTLKKSNRFAVVQRLGQPIRCYGKDFGSHKEGRRNFIEHVELNDKEGNKTRLRIKFNLKGPNGKAEAWAEVNKDMPTGEFVYLIVRTYTGELIKIQDQRQILQADSEEEREAMRRLLGQ